MLVRSIFKDYYDCGVAYGVDKEIIYIRNNLNLKLLNTDYDVEEFKDKIKSNIDFKEGMEFYLNYYNKTDDLFSQISFPHYKQLKKINKLHYINLSSHMASNLHSEDDFYISGNFVSFCGKLVPFIRLVKQNDSKDEYFFYNIDDITEFLLGYLPEDKRLGTNYLTKDESLNKYIKDFKKFFDSFQNLSNDTFNLFHIKFNSPIIMFRNYTVYDEYVYMYRDNFQSIVSGIIINPVLKSIDFKKYIEPIACFQEISMYISFLKNTEINSKDSIMDDLVIRDAKGFDNFSFKKRSKNKG